MENILFRINQISENEDIKITSLEVIIGASKGVLSKALNKNTDISSKWVTKIVENFPQYNAFWLLTGKGEMFNKSAEPLTSEEKIKFLEEKMLLMEENASLLKENAELKITNLKLQNEVANLNKVEQSRTESKQTA